MNNSNLFTRTNDELVTQISKMLEQSLQESKPNEIKHADVKAGDTVVWYNGPLTFREKVFEKGGKLYVRGTSPDRPLALSSIRMQLHKA